MDARLLARYPFLKAASAFVAERGPTLEDLLAHRAYARARSRGAARLLAAVREGEVPRDVPADDGEALVDLLGWGVARMLASVADDDIVTRRHALAEAQRVKALLDVEDPRVVEEVAFDLGVAAPHDETTGEHTLHFTDYLRYAVVLKDPAWKLVNQDFARPGHVRVERERLTRLVQEALRIRIEGELPLPVGEEVRKALAAEAAQVDAAAAERRAQFPAQAFGELDLDALPPCMKAILGMLQSGVNAPHSARFAITSFLHTVGLDADGIIKLFSAAPDFKEEMTRYQVEHITGKSSGTEYTPPGCQAMKTYGICYNPDRRCEAKRPDGSLYVTHPLSYYRWATKDRDRGRAAPSG